MTNTIEHAYATTFRHDVDWVGNGLLLNSAAVHSVVLRVAGGTSTVEVEVMQYALLDHLDPHNLHSLADLTAWLDDPEWQAVTSAVLTRG